MCKTIQQHESMMIRTLRFLLGLLDNGKCRHLFSRRQTLPTYQKRHDAQAQNHNMDIP
jgi:hypothetical protein